LEEKTLPAALPLLM